MDQQRIDYLLKRYATDALTNDEMSELKLMLQVDRELFVDQMVSLIENENDININDHRFRKGIFDAIISSDKTIK